MNHNQDGAISGTGLGLVLTSLLLALALGFGGWAYSSRQTYKNSADVLAAQKVEAAKQQLSIEKDRQYAEKDKSPLRTYNGPEAYGSLSISYPKTWSGMVDDSGSGDAVVNGYFNPNVVPSTSNQSSTFALRVKVVNQQYAEVLKNISSLQQNKEKPTTIAAYTLPKVPKAVGVQVSGGLPDNKTGVMIVLPLRAQTIELWTEGERFVSDFNTYILPNFSFVP